MAEFEKHTLVYDDLQEVMSLDREIKSINKKLKELRIQKKEAEARIYEFLIEKDQVGFKHKDVKVTIFERSGRKTKKATEKKEEILQVLKSSRDPTSKESLEDILEAIKGEPYTKTGIKIEKNKNKNL